VNQPEEANLTHHAMLVAWGQYAQAIGVIEAIESISLRQKTVDHRPQTKVLEFLVAIMGGLERLKDISLSAHPLDQDAAVARAWRQESWADHSGVSRTLSQLNEAEVCAIEAALDRISQPLIDREVVLAAGTGRIILDADLSPRQVSSTSETYTGAAFGQRKLALCAPLSKLPFFKSSTPCEEENYVFAACSGLLGHSPVRPWP